MQFYCSEQMQNRELNTCKQDIYSFLRFSLPTKPEPLRGSALFFVSGANYRFRTGLMSLTRSWVVTVPR